MKKYISYLLTLALLVPAFVSCTQERDFLSKKQKTHTVFFATAETATRTGLTIEDNMVKPDWRGTDLENIHFFEIDATNAAAPGTADEIQLSDDNRTAHFKAAISDEIIINVPTSSDGKAASGAKSAGVSPFTFAAVVAQMPDKDAFTFVIPSEQHPDAETLKDPNAEFLVGYSRKSYAEQYDYDGVVVDLYFDRVAALGRLAISGFIGTGEKVKSVTITANGGMTGKATYPGDFTLGDKNKVNFTKVNEPLVLAYGDGVAAPAEDPFYAYFVAVPGEATVTSIEVLTDQYKYTKTVAAGAKFTFTDEQLLNIDFALSADIAEEVTSESNTWYKASVLEAGQNYLIVSQNQALKNNEGATAAVAVSPVEGIITFESNVDPTIVWTAAARTEMTGTGTDAVVAGNFTLENSGVYLQRKSNNTEQEIVLDAEPSNKKYFVWDYVDNYLKHESSSTVTFFCSYNNGWVAGNTTNGAAPGTDIKTVEIYNNRPPVEISFASAEAKYDLDEGKWVVEAPALSAPEGATVTYTSSNEDIATVAADGTVTPKAAGNVRITATVAGDEEHQGASAFYDLAVTTSKITTWYKADEIVDGETYLIVSHEYVLENNSGDANAVQIEFSGDVILYNAPASVLWEAKATSTSGVYTLQNNGQYLTRISSGSSYGQTSYAPGASSSASSYYQWSYNSETDRISTTGNSTYFVYYSTNNSKWSMSTTEADHPAALYCSNPGLASRNLSFSAETVTHDLADGEDVNEPKLSGVTIDDVTYSVTEGSDVASVDANTGVVTLTGITGAATITASAPKTKTYKAESVSYILVVKDSNLPSKRYVLTNEIVAGKNYLIVSSNHALKNNSGNVADEGVIPVDGVIEIESGSETNLVWTATAETSQTSAGHFVFSNGGYRVNRLSSSGTFTLTFVTTSTAMDKYGVWDLQEYNGDTYLFHDSSTTMRCWLYYNSGWKISYQSNTTNPSSAELPTQLFVEDDGGVTPPTPQKQERNLAYSATSFTCTLGQTATFPTLSGVTDGVTYSSSNESVATISTSGVVTVKAAGTTTIKAEAKESDTYLAGSAQYTLTVSAASGEEKYYVLVTSEPANWNGKYLIVNTTTDGTGVAMNGASTANVTISGGKILSTPTVDGYALTVASAGEVHPNQTDSNQGLIAYDITFSDGDWLYWYSNKYKQTSEDQSTRHNKCTLFYDNGGVRLMSAGYNVNLSGEPLSSTPSKNYLHYSSSGSNYTMGSSYANDRVQLYKLDDGSSPGGGDDPGDDPTPTTSTYTQVSFATGITTGKYLIVNPADAQAFTTVTGYPNATAVTPSNGVISGNYASYEVTITKSGDNYTIQNGSGQYLYYVYTSGDTESRVAYKSDAENWTATSVSSDSNGFDLNCSGGSGRQHIYWSSTFFKIGSQTTGIHLYKKADNP